MNLCRQWILCMLIFILRKVLNKSKARSVFSNLHSSVHGRAVNAPLFCLDSSLSLCVEFWDSNVSSWNSFSDLYDCVWKGIMHIFHLTCFLFIHFKLFHSVFFYTCFLLSRVMRGLETIVAVLMEERGIHEIGHQSITDQHKGRWHKQLSTCELQWTSHWTKQQHLYFCICNVN